MNKCGFVYGDENGIQMYIGNDVSAAVAKAMEVVTDPTALAAIEMLTGKKAQPQSCPQPCKWLREAMSIGAPSSAPTAMLHTRPSLDKMILDRMRLDPAVAHRCKDFTTLNYSYRTKSGRREHPTVAAVTQAMRRLMSLGLVERHEIDEVYTTEKLVGTLMLGHAVEIVEHTTKVAVFRLTEKGRRG